MASSYTILLRYIRQIHTYAGIVLFPWAILYGVTGWMFNHPALASATPYDQIALRPFPLTSPSPLGDQLAQLLRLFNAGRPGNTAPYQLIDPSRATIATQLDFNVAIADTVHEARYSAGEATANIRRSARDSLPQSWAERWLYLPLQTMHKRVGYDSKGLPAGRFFALVGWGWGLAVDATVIAFLLWGISGFFMWWQYPKLRRWGGLAIVASAVVTGALGWAFHVAWL